MDRAFETVHLDELDRVASFQDVTWLPIRRRLGIEAFGINAYEGDAGKLVIEEHDETGAGGSGRQEEVYFVTTGRATFTVGGETITAPAGTFVFVRDPEVKRKAMADDDGTIVIAVGGTRGEAFTPSAWEWVAPALGRFGAGDFEGAASAMREGLQRLPDHPSLLYNLACAEALGGSGEPALEHLRRALDVDPSLRDRAREDEDFASLRDDPRFSRLVAGEPDRARQGA